MQITFLCRDCYRECRGNPARDKGIIICPSCKRQQVLRYTRSHVPHNQVDVCAVCHRTDFYVRDDTRRVVGMILLLAGLGAGYFTRWISLPLGGIGFYWYSIRYPKVTICYHCYAKYRFCRLNPLHQEYDMQKMKEFEQSVRNDRGSRDFNLG